jgi:hypothetical protein
MTRQVTDQLYIDLEYFTPEDYYTYEAVASAAISSTATVTATITVIGVPTEASANLTSAFTQSSQINITASAASSQTSAFTQTAIAGRIKQGAIALTDAFTPTLTVDVFKNSTSVIECVATVTADTVATRVFNITLASIVTQSLQSQRLAGLTSNQSAQFSISASADNRTQEGTASLSTTATVSATANKVRFFNASFTSAFTQTTIATDLADRPLTAQTPAGSLSFDTSIKQFGSASLFSNTGTAAYYAGNDVQLTTNQMFLSGWYRPSTAAINAGSDTRISSSPAVWRLELDGSTEKVEFKISADGFNYATVATSSSSLVANTWYHIAVSKSGTSYAIWINGNRVATGSYFDTPYNTGINTPQIWIGNSGGHYDEWEMQTDTYGQYNPSSTTYTTPTTESVNSDNTEFLFHFNGNYNDDNTGQLSAALTATASLTAIARRTRVAASAMSSTASLTADGIKVVEASANLTAQGFVVAANGRIKSQLADLDSAFALSANAGRLLTTSVALTTTASLTATALDLDLGSAALTSAFALTAQGRFFRIGGVANIVSTATLTANTTEISTPDELLVSNTRALFHLDAVPAINVYSSSTSISTGSATVTTGKFSNGLAIDPSTTKYLNSTLGFDLNGGVDFVHDFWWARGDDIPSFGSTDTVISILGDFFNNSANVRHIGSQQTGSIPTSINMYSSGYHGNPGWGLTNGTIYINWNYNSIFDPTDNVPGLVSSYQITDNNFHHFLYSRTRIDSTDATYRLFIDGVKVIEYVGGYSLGSSSTIPIKFGQVGERYSVGDEWRLIKGITQTSNFTPQTAAYFPPNVQYLRNFNVLLEPKATLVVDFLKVKFGEGALDSAFAQTTAISRTRTTNVALSSQFAQTTAATKAALAQASLTSTAVQTATAKKFVGVSCAISAQFAQTVDNTRLRDNPAQLTSQATQTVVVSKFVGVTSNVLAEFTQTAINGRIRYANTQFESIATEVTAAFKNATGTVLMESAAALNAVVRVTTDTPVTMLAQATVLAEPRTLVDAEASMSAQVQMTTEATKFRPSEANLTTSATQTAQAVKTARGVAQLTSTSTLSVTPTRVLQYSSNQTAQSTVTVIGSKFRQGAAALTSQSTITALVTNVVRFNIALQAQGFVLSDATVIHIDPYTTYMIPQETRNTLIGAETRLYVINQETRVNTIIGSTL